MTATGFNGLTAHLFIFSTSMLIQDFSQALAAAIVAIITVASANALETVTHSAKHIEVVGGDAVMYTHEKVLLGLSCRSGPVGKLNDLSEVRIGDTLTVGIYSFRVGSF
jgi:hypothetical protein